MGKEIDVIKILIESKDEKLSINQIAKKLNKDYKNTHNIVTRLSKMKIVQLEDFGNSYGVRLINQSHPLIYETELKRQKELLTNKNLAVMKDVLGKIQSKLYILLVFGSYAKGTQTKHSDIDLIYIVPDESQEKMEKEIHNLISTLPLPIHTHIFTESEFITMKLSKQTTVGSEAMNHNIILHGIEAYYELIR